MRFLVTDKPEAPIAGLVERFRSGPLRLFESPNYDDHYVVAAEGVNVTDIRIIDDEIREFPHIGKRPGFRRKGRDVDRAYTQTHLGVSRHAVRAWHFERGLEAESISQPLDRGRQPAILAFGHDGDFAVTTATVARTARP